MECVFVLLQAYTPTPLFRGLEQVPDEATRKSDLFVLRASSSYIGDQVAIKRFTNLQFEFLLPTLME